MVIVLAIVGVICLIKKNGKAKKSFLWALVGVVVFIVGAIVAPKEDDSTDNSNDAAKSLEVAKKDSSSKKTSEPTNKVGYKLDKSELKEEGYVWVPKDTTDLNVKFSVGEDNKINSAKIMEHGTRDGMLKYFKKVTASDLKAVDDPDNPDLYYSQKLGKYYHVGSWEDSDMKNVYKSAQLNIGKNADEMN